MKWDALTMSQKQALMKIYVNNGITNLDEIRNHYNKFDNGGSTNMPQYITVPREQAIIQSAPSNMERFKSRTSMIGNALSNFLPSKENVAENILTNKVLGKTSGRLGILGKAINLPDTISNIENLKKAVNLPYNQGLIDAGKGQTLINSNFIKK